MEQVIKKISEYKTILIHGHERPDGDCIGSQLALKDIIQNSFPDKFVYAVGPSSEYVSFLGELDIVEDEQYAGALAIVVDTANQDRISDKRYLLAKEIIKIDHHDNSEAYGNYQLFEFRPACAQIIAEMLSYPGMMISPFGAQALYTGIFTDTGGFRYDGVTGDTMRAVAMLIDKGVKVDYIDNCLSMSDINVLRFKGYVLENFKTTDEGFAYIVLTRDIVNKFHISDETASAQVSQLAGIKGYPVWALFIECPNEIRVRLRSRDPRVDLLANKYGGGGHQKASGAHLSSFAELSGFVNDVNQLLIDYKNRK